MPQARGFVTEDELQIYGGANVMLLDDVNGQTTSGTQTASGGGNYEWSISWDSRGFTGRNWQVFSWDQYWDDFEREYNNGTLEQWLESEEHLNVAIGVSSIIGMFGTYEGCATYSRVDT